MEALFQVILQRKTTSKYIQIESKFNWKHLLFNLYWKMLKLPLNLEKSVTSLTLHNSIEE